MFEKIERTEYPPSPKPLMVWDGHCGFCTYWVARWQRFTGDRIDYRPYQEAAPHFPDIDQKHFKQASRLIETDGRIYSGPRSAYRTFTYGSSWAFLDRWYARHSFFTSLSDGVYNWVAKHRGFLFKVSKAMYGTDPQQVRPFWAIYLALAAFLLYQFFLR